MTDPGLADALPMPALLLGADPPAAGPLAEPSPPGPAPGLLAEVRRLVGHLELLRDTSLSRLQSARLALALASAHDLLGALGGAVEADTPGEAPPTRVVRRPPAVREGPAPLLLPFDSEAVAGLRVLIVDDNSINLSVAQSMLRVLGVHADTAGDGAEALARFAAAPYDLIFMDVMLPTTTGQAVTRALRERYGRGPFIIGVTAMPDAEAACLEAGMDAFYQKPLRIAQVSDAVRRGLAARRSPPAARGPRRPPG